MKVIRTNVECSPETGITTMTFIWDTDIAWLRKLRKFLRIKPKLVYSKWTPEFQEDLMWIHGIDIEKEMFDAISYEVKRK